MPGATAEGALDAHHEGDYFQIEQISLGKGGSGNQMIRITYKRDFNQRSPPVFQIDLRDKRILAWLLSFLSHTI